MSNFAYFPGPNPYLPPKKWFLHYFILRNTPTFYFLSKKKSTKLLKQHSKNYYQFFPRTQKVCKVNSVQKGFEKKHLKPMNTPMRSQKLTQRSLASEAPH